MTAKEVLDYWTQYERAKRSTSEPWPAPPDGLDGIDMYRLYPLSPEEYEKICQVLETENAIRVESAAAMDVRKQA